MPGFANDSSNNSIMWSDNVDFSGAVVPSRAITTNGQLLIGSTIAPNIQPGILTSPDTSITIGYSSPNITLKVNTAFLFKWQDVSGAFISNRSNGYFITATASSTLPAGASEGDTIEYALDTAQILTLTASVGQTIRIGNNVSSSGGTAVSTLRGDSLSLVFRAASQSWIAVPAPVGTWTLA